MMHRLGVFTAGLLTALGVCSVTLYAAGVTNISSGSALPTNCNAGNLFIKTSATAGLYWCSTPGSPGAWAAVGGGSGITALTGDVTATGPGSAAATLASSGVSAGSYLSANITVDAKGRVTSAASGGSPPSGSGYLLSGTSSPNGVTYIQSAAGGGLSIAFSSSVTSGDLLIVAAGSEGSVDPITVTDTVGTTYTRAAFLNTSSNHLAVYYGLAAGSGANTVTGTQGASFARMAVAEFSGVDATIDATATVYNGTTTASLSITTVTAGAVVFAAIEGFHSSNTFLANSGVTVTAQSNGSDANAIGYRYTGAAGSYTTSLAIANGGDNSPFILVAFAPTSRSTVGSDGDYYIDAASKTLYGPRVSGVYPPIGSMN